MATIFYDFVPLLWPRKFLLFVRMDDMVPLLTCATNELAEDKVSYHGHIIIGTDDKVSYYSHIVTCT